MVYAANSKAMQAVSCFLEAWQNIGSGCIGSGCGGDNQLEQVDMVVRTTIPKKPTINYWFYKVCVWNLDIKIQDQSF